LICSFFAGETMHRVARDATPLRKIVKRLSFDAGSSQPKPRKQRPAAALQRVSYL
jgi:hypothetical protein